MASFEFLASVARLIRKMATKSEAGKSEELSVVSTTPCILIPPEFPEFWPGSPATWLLKMEAAFCLRNIILQQERYAIMVDILPPSLRCVVPPPGPQPYDRLRDFVLALPQPDSATPLTTCHAKR
ncbi:hypothetical protein MRX96_033877 [Rhipicephalus microplus]